MRTARAGMAPAALVALGSATGHTMVAGAPSWPPLGAQERLIVILLPLALAGAAAGLLAPSSSRIARCAAILAPLFTAPIVLWGWGRAGGRELTALLWCAAIAPCAIALWAGARRLEVRDGSRWSAAGWGVISLASAVALALSNSILLGAIALGLAGGLGAAWLAGCCLRPKRKITPIADIFVAMSIGLLVAGVFLVELTAAEACLLGLAVVTPLVIDLLPQRNTAGWGRKALAWSLLLLPTALALGITFTRLHAETGSYDPTRSW